MKIDYDLINVLIAVGPRMYKGWRVAPAFTGGIIWEKDSLEVYITPWWEDRPDMSVDVNVNGEHVTSFTAPLPNSIEDYFAKAYEIAERVCRHYPPTQEVRVTLEVRTSVPTAELNARIRARLSGGDITVVKVEEEKEIYGNK